MFKTEAFRKHSAAAICAVLFSSTCLLSAVGPVKAAEYRPATANSVELTSSTAVVPLA